jgi:hypothetical protein
MAGSSHHRVVQGQHLYKELTRFKNRLARLAELFDIAGDGHA